MAEGSYQQRPLHRRAHSDTGFLAVEFDREEELLFDASEIDDLTSSFDFFATPGLSHVSPMAVDPAVEGFSSNGPNPPPNLPKPRPIAHTRSLSVDSDYFEGFCLAPASGGAASEDQLREKSPSAEALLEQRRLRLRSNSMDRNTASMDLEAILAVAEAGSKDESKKAIGMSPNRLAELALIDPKRARRIIANRQSAARSKERRIKYTNELEKKVQTLQNEATTLSTQITKLQRETADLSVENSQLKLRLDSMEQQAQLRDALNEALREELGRLKIAAARTSAANGNSF